MIKSRKGQEGFTLIELLVVVLIIGILAAIAIPAFLGQKKGAQDSNAKSLLRNAAIAMESWYSDHQSFDGATAGTAMTATDFATVEPNITMVIEGATVAQAKDNQFDATFAKSGAGATAPNDSYTLVTQSASKTYFVYARDVDAKTAKCKSTSAITACASGAATW